MTDPITEAVESGWRPPDFLAPDPVAEASARAAALRADLKVQRDVVRRSKSALEIADREDTSARADAMLAGTKDPGRPARKRVEAEIANAEDSARVLDVAARRARAGTRAACVSHAQEWRAMVADAVGDLEERGADLLADLAGVIDELHRARETFTWLDGDLTRAYRDPTKLAVELYGKRHQITDVLELVRAAVVPPVAVERPLHIEGTSNYRGTEIVHEPAPVAL